MKPRNTYQTLVSEAQALLREGRYSASVQVSGRILEKALRELLARHWRSSDAEERTRIEKIQREVAGDQRSIDRLTMGQLLGICRRGHVLEKAQVPASGAVKLLNVESLDAVLKIRNAVTHSEGEPRHEEAQFVLDQGLLLLAETGLLEKENSSSPPRRVVVRLVFAVAALVTLTLLSLVVRTVWTNTREGSVEGVHRVPVLAQPGTLTSLKPAKQTGRDSASSRRLAILPFENASRQPGLEPLGMGLAEMITTDLSGVEGLDLVERSRLRQVLEEQKLQGTDGFDPASAAKLGRLLGADSLLMGGFFEFAGTLRLDARIVSVQTSEILGSSGVSGPRDSFLELQRRLAAELAPKLGVRREPRAYPNPSGVDTWTAALAYSEAIRVEDGGNGREARRRMEALAVASPFFTPASQYLARGTN